MFATALVLRLLIAPYLGFYGDLRLFQQWAIRLGQVGPHHFYVQGQFADYPPGYLYVLWLLGTLSAAPGYVLLKLPAIVADLGLALVAGVLAARLAPASLKARVPVRAAVAAAVLFNPAVIALSAVWGQVDSVPAVFALLALLLLLTGPRSVRRDVAAFLVIGLAIAIKPQSGFGLPVMLYVLYHRYIRGCRGWGLVDGILLAIWIAFGALFVWGVSGLAFGLDPIELYRFYKHSASVYPVTSANALNLWGAIGFWRNDSAPPHELTILGLSAARVGTLAFAASIVFVLVAVHRALRRGASEALIVTVGAASTSLLGYTLLTRMHERYMFLGLASLAPVVFLRPLRVAYVALSGLFLLALWYPFTYFNAQWGVQSLHLEPWFGWLLGGYATDTWQKRAWSILVTVVVLAAVWTGLEAARRVRPEAVASVTGGVGELQPHAAPVEKAEAAEAAKKARWWPLGLGGLACLFGLVVLRDQLEKTTNLNDSAFHLLMVRWASGQIHEGRIPLDGWFPDLSLGSSFFHHYQSLPQTLTAYASALTGAGNWTSYLWFQYLLLALWPVSVYLGARLLEWDRWTAGAAAAVSPLIVSTPGYGFEQGSYTWQGYGVYSQLWGMWLLPLAWGLTWQAVARGRRYAAAAAALGLTMACHFIAGYLAVLTVGVWVIVAAGPFLRRAGRGALVAIGAMLVASWVLVPLIGDTKFSNQSAYYKGTFFNDSYGARKVLGWLVHGQLFDAGRFPVITLLALLGAVMCVVGARRDPRGRALLGAFVLGLFLFFGRPTWGRLLDLLPGFGDVQIHRFLMGVDMAAILLAGVGLGRVLRESYAFAWRSFPAYRATTAGAAALVLGVVLLGPAWADIAHSDRTGATEMQTQQQYDAADGAALNRLVAIVKARGGGRVYAGLRGNWGADYKIGYVPVHAWLAQQGVDAIGFTFRTVESLSTDPEAAFDETNPAQYQMYDIRYLLLPVGHRPPVPARLIGKSGRHRLYQVATSGYFQVVDGAPALKENRADVNAASAAFRASNDASRNIYPGVAFAGGAAPAPTFTGSKPPAGTPGDVLTQSEALDNGKFTATVRARRPAVVLLKATYDPRWRATVDGVPTKTQMMAPSLVGVAVPPGVHVVAFHYAPYGNYPLLFLLGAAALVGLWFAGRRRVMA
jgi:Gpi18-like mannosyltransferase